MHDVLVVYKQVEMQFDENGNIIVPTEGPWSTQYLATKSQGYRQLQQQEMISGRLPKKAVYIGIMTINALERYHSLPGLTFLLGSQYQ